MKCVRILLLTLFLYFPLYVTSCSSGGNTPVEENKEKEKEEEKEEEKGEEKEEEKGEQPSSAYELKSEMQGSESLVGKTYADIHKYMRSLGWDYSEHPNSSEKDHYEGVHCENIYDETLKQYVFRFINHAGEALDGDRGKLEDRQRNEMKSQTSAPWYKMNGNWDEWQILEWKFLIPKGFQPSGNFCHLHQLKAQEGDNNGSPLITITARSDKDGSNRRIQVIHTGDKSATNKGTIIDNLPMSDFEDQWIQVKTEMHYTHNGVFKITMTRISDGKVLVDKGFTDVDLWRRGATNIRNKFGIYRSFGRKMESEEDRPTNGIKDETFLLGDFKVYEKNTNANPQPHE